MNLQITVTQLGARTGYAIFNIYDPSAPSIVIDSQNVSLPIATTAIVEFADVADQTYLVKTFLSNDTDYHHGTQIGTDFFAYPGLVNSSVLRADLWLITDTTPGMVAGSDIYIDTSLAGWTYSLELPGVGSLQPNIDYNVISTGGFQLLQNTFQSGEKYVLHFSPNVTSNSGSSSFTNAAGKLFSDTVLVSGTTILDNNAIGKYIIGQTLSNSFQITLPDISTIPENVITSFIFNGGTFPMITIYSVAGIYLSGVLKQNIYLAQGEELWIVKKSSALYAIHARGNFDSVGEILECFYKSVPNTLQLNGSLLQRAAYPRLWEFVNTKLISGMIVSEGNWGTKLTNVGVPLYPNIGKFSTGNGTTTFRLPLIMETKDSANSIVSSGFTRGTGIPNCGDIITGISGNDNMGVQQIDAVGNFYTDITGYELKKSGASNSVIALKNITDVVTSNPVASNIGMSGKTYIGNNTYVTNGETRPMNVRIFKLIRY